MTFAPALRRFTFTTHVTSSVGWVGTVLVFFALAAIGLSGNNEHGSRSLSRDGAGVVHSRSTRTRGIVQRTRVVARYAVGRLRHYWIVIKLGITAFCTVILMIYTRTFQQMAGVAADPVRSSGIRSDHHVTFDQRTPAAL